MEKNNFVIGVDYGTDSVRSIIVNAANGEEISSSVFYYPRWKDGLFCLYLQHKNHHKYNGQDVLQNGRKYFY